MTAREAGPGERLNAELADCQRQFEAVRLDARKLLDGLTDAQFNWRLAPGRWSIGECLEHLNAGCLALPRFDRVISDARSRGLGQWFAFLAAHERRHLWQAWQVRRHPEFPAR